MISRQQLKEHASGVGLPFFTVRFPLGTHSSRDSHDHEYSEIAIVARGEAWHGVGNRGCTITAGDVLVLHPGVVHYYDRAEGMDLVNIAYDREHLVLPMLDGYTLPLFRIFFPGSPLPDSHSWSEPVTHLTPDALEKILKMVEEFHDEMWNFHPGNLFMSLAHFMRIVTVLARSDSLENHSERWRFQVGDAVSYINRNYAADITIDQLGKIARMSRRNFFIQFKAAMNCSPIEYLLRVRTDAAAEMLVSSDASISEIALQCGFCDGNYFSRKFHLIKGIPPREFRRIAWRKLAEGGRVERKP